MHKPSLETSLSSPHLLPIDSWFAQLYESCFAADSQAHLTARKRDGPKPESKASKKNYRRLRPLSAKKSTPMHLSYPKGVTEAQFSTEQFSRARSKYWDGEGLGRTNLEDSTETAQEMGPRFQQPTSYVLCFRILHLEILFFQYFVFKIRAKNSTLNPLLLHSTLWDPTALNRAN